MQIGLIRRIQYAAASTTIGVVVVDTPYSQSAVLLRAARSRQCASLPNAADVGEQIIRAQRHGMLLARSWRADVHQFWFSAGANGATIGRQAVIRSLPSKRRFDGQAMNSGCAISYSDLTSLKVTLTHRCRRHRETNFTASQFNAFLRCHNCSFICVPSAPVICQFIRSYADLQAVFAFARFIALLHQPSTTQPPPHSLKIITSDALHDGDFINHNHQCGVAKQIDITPPSLSSAVRRPV